MSGERRVLRPPRSGSGDRLGTIGARSQLGVLALVIVGLVALSAVVVATSSRADTPGSVTVVARGIGGPVGIVKGADGNLWFTNAYNNSIGRATPAGVISSFTGAGINHPLGIAAGRTGTCGSPTRARTTLPVRAG